MSKHEEYNQALEDYAQERIDNIEKTLDTEASKMLIHWVRDNITKISEHHKS